METKHNADRLRATMQQTTEKGDDMEKHNTETAACKVLVTIPAEGITVELTDDDLGLMITAIENLEDSLAGEDDDELDVMKRIADLMWKVSPLKLKLMTNGTLGQGTDD